MSKATDIFKEFNKKYKKEIFTVGNQIEACSRIPFTSPRANYMLHGGLPRGRVVEFAGPESSGKTTTALDIVGNAQRIFEQEWLAEIEQLEAIAKPTKEQMLRLTDLKNRGAKRALWVDIERTFDDVWARKLGVNTNTIYMMNPGSQSAEVILEVIYKLICTGEIGIVVVDSIAALVSDQELTKGFDESTYAGISKSLTRFSKLVESACPETDCMVIGINQVRENISAASRGGPLMTTPGGKCWKHTCSVRMTFRQGAPFDEKFSDLSMNAENPCGHTVHIKLEKTKICSPDRKVGFYTLSYTNGVVGIKDMVDLAIKNDIIHQSGAWYTFVDPETGELVCKTDDKGVDVPVKAQGTSGVYNYLQKPENTWLFDKITAKLDAIITHDDYNVEPDMEDSDDEDDSAE